MSKQHIKESVKVSGKLKITVRDVATGEVKRVYEYNNLNPLVMKSMIMNNLIEDVPTNSMSINYVALGTGTNAPAAGNTQLQTETYRNIIASKTQDNNVGYITGFFSDLEVSGTFREIGLFSNATASANSGVLVSRVAINVAKSTSESLTVDWTLTIS